jgi:hypothetical protein
MRQTFFRNPPSTVIRNRAVAGLAALDPTGALQDNRSKRAKKKSEQTFSAEE